jgi:phosphatidylglycerol:prolipoprotein diacylglycerol transferase
LSLLGAAPTLRGLVDKVAFNIGPLPVHWFGLLVAAAFLVGLWTASRRAARDGLAPEKISDAGVWLILGTILGARGLYVISYWNEHFAGKPWTDIFMVQQGGLVYYGGLVGATLAGVFYIRRHRLPLWKVADALAPSIALGYFVGRFGCLMNGCCYGRPTTLPWAIHFPADHPTMGVGVHPVQIYDALFNLGLSFFLGWLHRRKKFDGQIFAAYLIGYSILRSIAETFRGDYPVLYFGDVATPAQLVGGAILVAGLLLYWKLPRPQPKT